MAPRVSSVLCSIPGPRVLTIRIQPWRPEGEYWPPEPYDEGKRPLERFVRDPTLVGTVAEGQLEMVRLVNVCADAISC